MKKGKKTFLILLLTVFSFLFLFFGAPETSSAACSIDYATFTPFGDQKDDWYKKDAPPAVRLNVAGKDCAGTSVKVSLYQDNTFTLDHAVEEVHDKPVTFENNAFYINLVAGTTGCTFTAGYDCEYYIQISSPAFSTYSSDGKPGGNLEYEMPVELNKPWQVGQVTQLGDTDTPAVPELDLSYHLLSPLPCEEGTDSCETGKLEVFNPTDTENNLIGRYLNIMFRIFIGLCAILAIMMIVIGGLEYMTIDLVSSKEHAKQRIWGAVLGLLLALGSYAILNQINPDLLKTDFSSLKDVTVQVSMEELETLAEALDSDDPISQPKNGLCPEGVIKTASGIPACQRIAGRFDEMITASKAAGLKISGYGYRSPERQKELRIQNCKGDFTTRPGDCHPPTALPGLSNHNSGLAFDLRCDGSKIAHQTNKCFVWLKDNAGNYGLKNLPSEPWHWSVDGH